MSVYAAGRTTGFVVDAGDSVTHTVPVYEGFTISFAVKKMEIAGNMLSAYLKQLI